jgi:hypothetical protein
MLVAAPWHWPGLANAVGHPELPHDPRFADPDGFATNSAVLTGLLDAEFRSLPLAHWQEVLGREHITYSVIQSPEQAAQDPQLRATPPYGSACPMALRRNDHRSPGGKAPQPIQHAGQVRRGGLDVGVRALDPRRRGVSMAAPFAARGSDTSPAAVRRTHPEWVIPPDACAQQVTGRAGLRARRGGAGRWGVVRPTGRADRWLADLLPEP